MRTTRTLLRFFSAQLTAWKTQQRTECLPSEQTDRDDWTFSRPVINKLQFNLSGLFSQFSPTPFSLPATSLPASDHAALVLLELGRHPWWELTMTSSQI